MDWSVEVPLWVFALFVTVFALVGVALALWCWHLVECLLERDAQVDALRRYYMAHIITQKLKAAPTVKRRTLRRSYRKPGGQKVRVS